VTWNVNLIIKDGKVDPETVTLSGTPPDGPIYLNGHEGWGGTSIGGTVSGIGISVFIPKKEEESK
jgi:hypothetical protein